ILYISIKIGILSFSRNCQLSTEEIEDARRMVSADSKKTRFCQKWDKIWNRLKNLVTLHRQREKTIFAA
ncbi:MAG: hypothetical protein IKY01_10890, partial [Prevotella sp.]|nr:hypothetical protein [Prevotella sp.]